MSNPVHWFEIATKDLERAKTFYATVFERNFQYIDMPGTKMYMFEPSEDGKGSSGALLGPSEESQPSTIGSLLYFNSEDCAIEASRVEAAGGKIIVPKTDIGEFGFFVQFIDTEGNRIGIHSQN